MSDNPEQGKAKPGQGTEVERTSGTTGDGATTDPLDQYRYTGSPEEVGRTGGADAAERQQFRREAHDKLNPIITSLESGRNNMQTLHELAAAGQGPGTKAYDDAFKAAKGAYFQAIDQASKMLYDTDAEGRLTPNKFYKDVEAERVRLQADMAAAKDKNPAEYQRLAQENAMLGDVLRANGYAHANFGLALVRSSVYLPKAERDKQMEQGNQMLMLASRYDKYMMGDPPNVPPDPNFMKHRDAIMKVVNETPYKDGGTRPGGDTPPPTATVPDRIQSTNQQANTVDIFTKNPDGSYTHTQFKPLPAGQQGPPTPTLNEKVTDVKANADGTFSYKNPKGEVVSMKPDQPLTPAPGPGTQTTGELPQGYKLRTAGSQSFIDGQDISVPTGKTVLKLDGQTADPNDPLAIAQTGDLDKAIAAADALDKVPLITQITALKGQLGPLQASLKQAMDAAKADPKNPLNKYVNDSERINGEQTALRTKMADLVKSGLPTDGTAPTQQQQQQQQALAWMWANVNTTADLQKFLTATTPPELKAMADAAKSHAKWAEINSSFGQFLNNKTALGALEDGLKNNPATKDFYDKKMQLIQGTQQLNYLTQLYISPITLREARVDQLTADPEVQALIKAQDKANFPQKDDPEVKAIRQRVNELINMQAKPEQGLLDLQKALGDASTSTVPPQTDNTGGAQPDRLVSTSADKTTQDVFTKNPDGTYTHQQLKLLPAGQQGAPQVLGTEKVTEVKVNPDGTFSFKRPSGEVGTLKSDAPATVPPTTTPDIDPATGKPREVNRTGDVTNLPPDVAAKIKDLPNVEKAFSGAAIAFSEVAALQRFATEVKLLREFDAKVKAMPEADRTPENIAKLQREVMKQDEFMSVMYGPDAGPQGNPPGRPDLYKQIDQAIAESQQRNFSTSPYLAQKYVQAPDPNDASKTVNPRPNLANEVKLDPTGKYLAEIPADVRKFFDEANKVLADNKDIPGSVAAQRAVYKQRLDAAVPPAEQTTIQQTLNTLQTNFDTAMAALKPEVKGPLTQAYAQYQQDKVTIGQKYLQAIPTFQTDLQAVVSGTQPNSQERAKALNDLQVKYMAQVEADQRYQAELATAYTNRFGQLKSMDPGIDAVMNAQKALDDYTSGKDPTKPNQTPQEQQALANKIGMMDGYMTATKDLDALEHAAAVVQSYQARALLLSANPQDRAKSLELMQQSTQDAGAAQYLALPNNEYQAAAYMGAAATQVMAGNAPVELFGSMVPGSGAVMRGIAGATNGYIGGSRLENQNAATLALAESWKYDPKFTQAQIAQVTAQGDAAGNGLLGDVSALVGYGGTYVGLSKFTPLPGWAKVGISVVAAGGTRDMVTDGKFDGPINDPGNYARAGLVGLGGHYAYRTLLGDWALTAEGTAAARMLEAQKAGTPIAYEGSKLTQMYLGTKSTLGAYLNPKNMLTGALPLEQAPLIGRFFNPVTAATLDAAAAKGAAEFIAASKAAGAQSYFRTVGTSFVIGAQLEGGKLITGEDKFTTMGDAMTKMRNAGLMSGLTSGVLVPMATMIPKWGFSKVPGINTLIASDTAGAIYAFGRTYASDFSQASMDWSMARDMKVASAAAQNQQDLAKALKDANPGMTDTEAQARALMVRQMQQGAKQRQAAAAANKPAGG